MSERLLTGALHIKDRDSYHTLDVLTGSVDDELDDQSSNPVQNAVITEALSGVVEDLSELSETVDDILVEQTIGETATVTNLENTTSFYNNTGGEGLKNKTLTDGVFKMIASGASTSPYVFYSDSWGTKKWIVGLKWRLTKVDPNLSAPENVRIHLGTTAYDHAVVWGEWVDFSEVATLNLTRIRFAVRNFPSNPPADSFYLEIKNLYLYDATDLSNNMISLIQTQQSANYQDGTVTYGEFVTEKLPDKSLFIEGKAADAKAVSDAIGEVEIDVKKYGVKGDGVTDDTSAIRSLFSSMSGNFYFPSGTYKISGTITLPAKSTMYGDGDATIINMYSCDDLIACTFRGGSSAYPYIYVNASHTKLHDFKLIGNNTLKQQRHFGIGVVDTDDCYISNVTVYNLNYDATQTDDNVVVMAYGIGVLRSYRIYIDHCYVEQCGYECIGIADYSHHCVVKNCITKNGWRTCIQVHRGAYDVDIIGNQMIQNAQAWDACFTLHGLTGDDLVRNLRIENNTFDASVSPRQRVYDYGAVIQLMSYCDGLWVENNRVADGDRGLYASASVEHLTIIGNLFQCNSESDYGLKIESANSIIVGNVVENDAGASNIIASSAVKSANVGIS